MTDTARRKYVRVTGDMEMQVIAYKTLHPLDDYGEIGEALDLPKRTVQYILTDLPRLRGLHKGEPDNVGSLKTRILAWLSHIETFGDVMELQRVLGRADDLHKVVHVLHDLKKDGRVDFDEDKNRDHPIRIHLTAQGRGAGLGKKETNGVDITAPQDAVAAPQDVVAEDVETPLEASPEGFPLLDALLAREGERISRDAKAMAYLEAAEALTSVDPALSKELAAKAHELDVAYPSPIEAEYLRYVAAHK